MTNQYTKDQLWKLYENLSSELQEAIFSVETADNIWNVCEKYNINEVSEVAKLVGNVLLGILSPDDFQASLEQELKIEKETAKKTAQEINRFIFYPVRTELEELYKIKISAPVAPIEPQKPVEKTKPIEKQNKDTYREIVG